MKQLISKSHLNYKNYLVYKRCYIIFIIILLLLFVLSGTFFSLYGGDSFWDGDKFILIENPSIGQIVFLVLGLIVFIATSVLTVVSNILIVSKYTSTKEEYIKEEVYEKKKKDVQDNINIFCNLKKGEIKWMYKMRLLSHAQYLDLKKKRGKNEK